MKNCVIIMSKLKEWNPEFSSEELEYYNLRKKYYQDSIRSIFDLRKSLNLSQIEVAKILNVTQSNISKMESRREDSLDLIAKIAESKGLVVEINLKQKI